MVTVACVKWGMAYGPEYVNTLYDMVRRNLQKGFPGKFVCFTDDATGLDDGIIVRPLPSGISGWWNKLYMFSPEAFEAACDSRPVGERVLYFDLDTAITGPLDAIAAYNGPFAILRDAYRPDGLQSSVMAWEAGEYDLWRAWHRAGCPMDDRGDQGFIEDYFAYARSKEGRVSNSEITILQDEFPGRFRSFKLEARNEIPARTSVVFFHGIPRPHEVKDGWVPHVWKVGGGSGVEFVTVANVSDDVLAANVKFAKGYATNWLKRQPAHNGTALIVGGGPSLQSELYRVRGMQMSGAKVFACNGSAAYLIHNGCIPNAHVILDARPENFEFVVHPEYVKIDCYFASQCHESTLVSARENLICFHAMQSSYSNLTADSDLLIGGGSTVGLKAISVAYALGYRNFRLFGFDSSYAIDPSPEIPGYDKLELGRHHAYPQHLNDGERIVEARVGEKVFKCAPWMVTQAEEFKELAAVLVGMGCTIGVYGEGLLPSIAQAIEVPLSAADIRAMEVLKRIQHVKNPMGVEIGVFAGAMSTRLLAGRQDLTLFMVDSWGEGSDEYKKSGDFHASLTQQEQNSLYGATLDAVAFANDRAHVIRAPSLETAPCIADQLCDFVFIDADHSLEAVRADIDAWWPKVKPGGWLCGHDYGNPEFPDFGVTTAVDERFPNRQLGENYTWFVQKPIGVS